MNACVEFGEFIRAQRLANGITARESAQVAEMLPSNFSKLEHGVLNPPKDAAKQIKLASAIGLKPEARDKFFDLAAQATGTVPVDIAEIISEEDALPLLLRTIGNKRLGKKEIERLVELVRGTGGGQTR
jgi:transcriptional regulator with XRE-family HTH domain